jgi:hypothetical protein
MFHSAAHSILFLVFQSREEVVVFDSGGDEFNAGLVHLGEQYFTCLVDEGDIFEIYDGVCARRTPAHLLPEPS